jgi:hypothetical protein
MHYGCAVWPWHSSESESAPGWPAGQDRAGLGYGPRESARSARDSPAAGCPLAGQPAGGWQASLMTHQADEASPGRRLYAGWRLASRPLAWPAARPLPGGGPAGGGFPPCPVAVWQWRRSRDRSFFAVFSEFFFLGLALNMLFNVSAHAVSHREGWQRSSYRNHAAFHCDHLLLLPSARFPAAPCFPRARVYPPREWLRLFFFPATAKKHHRFVTDAKEGSNGEGAP